METTIMGYIGSSVALAWGAWKGIGGGGGGKYSNDRFVIKQRCVLPKDT